ncbi:MAG: hypothetical protein ACRCSM_09905 [Sediminibacterium sp.]|jgi:hypothetical protein|nr:hypothetical protein [Asinibacterium sp. OR53]MBR2647975.1 hypothetical protein [Sediminibacterium sp.]MCA6441630.1 hypothetical protein [Chitinophagaceae bacterium]MCA6446307.1 hypothetical protein [Chitinophagaceae bacterium]
MWLFKKKKKEVQSDDKTTVSDKVAGKIAGVGIKVQQLFAENMNRIFMKTDFKRLKLILIVFSVCAGGYSIYLIVNSVFSPERKQKALEIQQMDIPKHFNKTGDETVMPEATIDEQTYLQIQDFRKYMDSLKLNRTNEYDSILQARPGLMDSVQVLEKIYLSQKQK